MFRIEATADTHFPIKPEQFVGADVLVVAGDFMLRGSYDELKVRLDAIARLPHELKLVVCGNHDKIFDPSNAAGEMPARLMEEFYEHRIKFLGYPFREEIIVHEGVRILGLPFVNSLPRWAFNRSPHELQRIVEAAGAADIVVAHSPPKYVRDGREIGQAWGVPEWNEYIRQHKPKAWICGHIHESYGVEKFMDTTVYNVANCNEKYEQVNLPMIIEVQDV